MLEKDLLNFWSPYPHHDLENAANVVELFHVGDSLVLAALTLRIAFLRHPEVRHHFRDAQGLKKQQSISIYNRETIAL